MSTHITLTAILVILAGMVAGQGPRQQTDPAGNTARGGGRSGNSGDDEHSGWGTHAPSLPAEEDIECYVEFTRTEVRGGRCTQLGYSGPHICQRGVDFQFQEGCEGVMRERQERERQEQERLQQERQQLRRRSLRGLDQALGEHAPATDDQTP